MFKITKYVCLALWGLFILGLLIGGGVLWAISNGYIGEMPSIEELENPQSKYATIVYSADSVELGRFSRAKENRVFINYNELSPNLINALVATEDARFLDHSGIDIKALFRAAFKTVLLHQRSAGGGSTITQQLAKQVYTKEVASNIWERAMQKPIEWVIAVKLEKLYTKEEIINMYLNHFDFCYNAVGIRSAARIYFDKLPSELDVEQSAMLVGMLQNPSLYNPIRRPEKTKNRRTIVLNQMYKAGYLTEAEYNDYKERPLLPQTDNKGNYKLAHSADHKEGMAPYLREYLRKIMRANKPNRSRYASWQDQQFYDDSLAWETNPLYGWCNKNKKPDGSHYDLTTDGLRIYTSINSHMQQYAEEAVVEHLRDYLQPAFTKEKQNQPNAPYSRRLTDDDVKNSLRRAMRQSERYTIMKSKGYSAEEIEKAFQKPIDMKLFSWEGEIDTIMSPWDSLRWQKQFLRAGFLCMDTLGYVKAYVGGPDFAFFQYDMVTAGRRQVGSTIKPLLYTLAMEEGRTPCDEELNTQPVLYDAIGRPWTPRDGGKQRIGEMVTLRWGLMRSNNWISARVMSRMTPEHFVDFLHS
ncbi:MAG: transglycosylase domain-containing protein, partial [Bacteroidales bacterium]|nr:transglycosylase domain-containing protein [Bacteroidales bacterium]